MWKQAPQLLPSVLRSVSQPATIEQSPKPAEHVKPQALPLQVGVPFGPVGQALPHAAQLLTSPVTSVSQPGATVQSP